MNWDEQLIEACTETDGSIHPHTDHVLSGAKWMREQLRTNESVEKVAKGIARLDPGEDWPDEYITDDMYRDECRRTARAAITALLGDT